MEEWVGGWAGGRMGGWMDRRLHSAETSANLCDDLVIGLGAAATVDDGASSPKNRSETGERGTRLDERGSAAVGERGIAVGERGVATGERAIARPKRASAEFEAFSA